MSIGTHEPGEGGRSHEVELLERVSVFFHDLLARLVHVVEEEARDANGPQERQREAGIKQEVVVG